MYSMVDMLHLIKKLHQTSFYSYHRQKTHANLQDRDDQLQEHPISPPKLLLKYSNRIKI